MLDRVSLHNFAFPLRPVRGKSPRHSGWGSSPWGWRRCPQGNFKAKGGLCSIGSHLGHILIVLEVPVGVDGVVEVLHERRSLLGAQLLSPVLCREGRRKGKEFGRGRTEKTRAGAALGCGTGRKGGRGAAGRRTTQTAEGNAVAPLLTRAMPHADSPLRRVSSASALICPGGALPSKTLQRGGRGREAYREAESRSLSANM